ncbi:N-acetylaspartate synthetase-like [Euwallacea fornicatus]|uniref:N-acetylaspartate synthetase-like n=1 Tax=Euwallacea fornicatus TaxID=995702 RepID=UPI00338E44D7
MYFIVIRNQRDNDTPQVSELVRKAYASNISNIFWGTLLNETTFQIIVIFTALLFIFFQLPILNCLVSMPLIPLMIYIYIYASMTMKSAQIMYDKKPVAAWVAEAHEPYFQEKDPASCWYQILTDGDLNEIEEKLQGRKRIIGTVAVMQHSQHPEWAWLYRVVVDQRYRRKGVALEMVKTAQEWCKNNKINRLELAISEYNEGARQLFDKTGFETKQLYHKKQFSKAYMLQMYLLTAEVRPTFS